MYVVILISFIAFFRHLLEDLQHVLYYFPVLQCSNAKNFLTFKKPNLRGLSTLCHFSSSCSHTHHYSSSGNTYMSVKIIVKVTLLLNVLHTHIYNSSRMSGNFLLTIVLFLSSPSGVSHIHISWCMLRSLEVQPVPYCTESRTRMCRKRSETCTHLSHGALLTACPDYTLPLHSN